MMPLAGCFLFYQPRNLGVSTDALGRILPLCPSVGLLVTDYMCEFRLLLNVLRSEVPSFESSQKERLQFGLDCRRKETAIKNCQIFGKERVTVTHREKVSTCTISIILPPFIITTLLLHSAPLNRFKHVTCIQDTYRYVIKQQSFSRFGSQNRLTFIILGPQCSPKQTHYIRLEMSENVVFSCRWPINTVGPLQEKLRRKLMIDCFQ